MTDHNVRAAGPNAGAPLATLRLPELQALAAELGIAGTAKLRKGELVDTISEAQSTAIAMTDSTTETSDVAPKKRAPRRATATAGVVTSTAGTAAAPSTDGPAVEAKAPSSPVESTATAEQANTAAPVDGTAAADTTDSSEAPSQAPRTRSANKKNSTEPTGDADSVEV
ncbi:MAG: Rho termination factor N-terminal domain-containing protein, partial [Terrimesophilobacter sp.]